MNNKGVPMMPLADRADSRANSNLEDDTVPALPFMVVPSSLEVSSSNPGYETSSGRGSWPPNLGQSGVRGTQERPDGAPSNGIAVELHHYSQQNNLTVNCAPSVIEGYIRYREQAAKTAAQAVAQASFVQAAAIASASDQAAQARVQAAEATATANVAATEATAASRVQALEAQATAIV